MRYILAIALIFAFSGISMADGIPTAVDAKNHPSVWTKTVYNGSGSDIVSGYIVEWDFDECDTTGYVDMCPWVQLDDTADNPWTAGVVPIDNNLLAGQTGDIIVEGVAFVRDGGNTVGVNTFVSSDGSGRVQDEGCASNDECILGIAIKNTAVATRPDLGPAQSIIYIKISPYTSD